MCTEESQDEEAQQTADESTAIPELEEVINRSKEEMQITSVGEMEEAIRPAESVIRKIQRHLVWMWESLWSVETHSSVSFVTLDVEMAGINVLFRDRGR
jgi:hypothetical protein